MKRLCSLYSKVAVTNFDKIQVQVFFGFASTWAQWERTDWDDKENNQSCYICLSYYWLAMINMENYIWLEGGWEREQMATKRILEQLIVTGIFPGEKFKSEAKQKHYPFFSAQGTVHGTAPAMLWLDEGGLPEMPSPNGINSFYPALNSSCSNADRNSWQGGENVCVPTVFWVSESVFAF